MKIPERLKEMDFWIERIGFPTIVCAFFAYLLFVRFGKVDKRFYMMLRYERAIMQKLKVQVPEIESDRGQ